MTAAQLQQLKEMAEDLVNAIPSGLMVDGNNHFFYDRDFISIIKVLALIEEARRGAVVLNNVIQHLEGRKQGKK